MIKEGHIPDKSKNEQNQKNWAYFDKRLFAIQKSTRPLFKSAFLQRIIEKMRIRFRWYYYWKIDPIYLYDDPDQQIYAIQQSTRTSIKKLQPLHEYFRQKSSWYYKWHIRPVSHKIHYSVLTAYTTIIVIGLGFALITPSLKVPKANIDFAPGITEKTVDYTKIYTSVKPDAKEITEKRTENTKAFKNPDGTTQYIVSSGILHYKSSDGKWYNIDSTISPNKDNTGFEMDKSIYSAKFEKNFLSNPLLTTTKENQSLSVKPGDLSWSNNTKNELISSPKEVEATSAGHDVTYKNAYGLGLDFGYETQDLQLNKKLTIPTLESLPISNLTNNEDLSLKLQLAFKADQNLQIFIDDKLWDGNEITLENKNIVFKKNNEVIWQLTPAKAWDSSVIPSAVEGSSPTSSPQLPTTNSQLLNIIPSASSPVIPTAAEGSLNSSIINGKTTIKKTGDTINTTIAFPYSFLKTAQYPVTIDPATVYANADDGVISGSNAVYATAHDTSTYSDSSASSFTVGQQYDGSSYTVFRSFLRFDTSAIEDTATVGQANLHLTPTNDNSVTDFNIDIFKTDWTSTLAANTASDYTAAHGATKDVTLRSTSGLAINTDYASPNLDTTRIIRNGYSYFILKSSLDASVTAPGLEADTVSIASQDHATPAYRPYLSIITTTSDFTWDGGGDGVSWSDPLNWDKNAGYPDTNDDKAIINIGSASIVTPTGAPLTIGELSIASGYSGTIALGNNLTITNAGGATGNLTLAAGTLTTTYNSNIRALNVSTNATISGTGILLANSSVITVGGSWDASVGTFTRGTSTVNLTGTGTLTSSYNSAFYDLNCAYTAKTTTLLNSFPIRHNVTFQGDSTGSLAGGYSSFQFYSSTPTGFISSNGATMTGNTGLALYGAVATPMVLPAGNFYNSIDLVGNDATGSAKYELGGNISIRGIMYIYGNAASRSSVFDTKGYNISSRTDSSWAPRIVIGYNGDTTRFGQLINSSQTTDSTISLDNNIEIYSGAGSSKLDASGTGASPHTININLKGVWLNNDTYIPGAGTVDFQNTVTKTINSGGITAGKIFNNVIHSGTGTLQLLTNDLKLTGNLALTAGTMTTLDGASSRNMTVGGSLTIGTGATLLANASIISVSGSWDNVNGTFTAGTSTVAMTGTGTVNVGGSCWGAGKLFKNITVNTSGTITLSSEIWVTNIVTLTTGTLNGAYGININSPTSGSFVNSGITYGAPASSIIFIINSTNSGAPDIIPSTTLANPYPKMYIKGNTSSNTNYANLAGDINISGNLSITGNQTTSKALVSTTSSNYAINIISGGSLLLGSSGTATSQGELSINSSTLTVPGDIQIYNGSGGTKLVSGTSGLVKVAGLWNNADTFTPSTGTVEFTNTATKTLNSGGTGAGKVFNNITHSGAGQLQLLTNNLNMTGNFTNSAGTFDTNSLDMTVAGSWTNSATFTAGIRTVTFDGTATGKTINTSGTGAGKDFYNLTFNGSGGAWTLLTNAMTVANALTITAGTFDPSTLALSVTGAFSNAANFGITGTKPSGIHTFSGTWTNASGATFFASSNATATSIIGNIDCDGTLNANTASNGNITIQGATVDFTNGTYTKGSGTLKFNAGSGATQTFTPNNPSSDFGFVSAASSGGMGTTVTVAVAADLKVTTILVGIAAQRAILNITNTTLTLTGTGMPLTIVANGGSTVTTTGSTIIYTGSGTTTTVTAFPTGYGNYNNLTLTPSSATTYNLSATMSGSQPVAGAFTINTNATFNPLTYDLTVTGAFTNNGNFGISAPPPSGVHIFSDTWTNNNGAIFYSSSSATATTITGNLTTAGTLSAYGNIDIAGNWTRTGTFNTGGRTVTFNGTTTQTITGTNTWYNLTINNTYISPDDTYDVDPTAAQTVTNTFTVTDGQYSSCAADTYSRVLIGSSGILKPDSGANINVSDLWANSGGYFNSNSGTVTFTSISTGRTINPGSSSFYNLTFNGSGGAWSPSTNALTIQGDLTMTAGTFDTSNGNADVTVNGNVQCGVTCGTINMTNNFQQLVSANKNFGTSVSGATAWSFYNLTFSFSAGTPTITTSTAATGDISVNNILTISANTTLNAGNRTWRLLGTSTPFVKTGTFTCATSTISYEGTTGIIPILSDITYYNLQTNPASGTPTYRFNGDMPPSFLAGTKVKTSTGTVNIEDLKTGDSVYAYDTALGKPVLSEVFATIVHPKDQYYIINEKIKTTGNHVFYMADKSTKKVENLKIGDYLSTWSGVERIDSLEIIVQDIEVYDIGVKNYHNFYAEDYLVHNAASDITITGNFTMAGIGAATIDANYFYDVITVAGNLSIGSSQTFSAPGSTGGSLSVAGNWTRVGTFTHNGGTVTFNDNTTQTITGTNTWYGLTINNTHASPSNTYDVDPTAAQTVAGTLMVNDGQYTACTGDTYVNVILSTNGIISPDSDATINISGSWTNNGGSFQHTVSTIYFFGGGTQYINGSASSPFGAAASLAIVIAKTAGTTISMSGSASYLICNTFTQTSGNFTAVGYFQTYGDTTISSGTFAAAADTNIYSNLAINGGTFSASTSTKVGGYWSNSSTFIHNNGTITFNGTAGQTVYGNTTFYNLTMDTNVNGANQINFIAGSKQTIANTWSLDGAVGKVLTLRSTSTNTAWKFDIPASFTAGDYVNVQDSQTDTIYRIAPGANTTNAGNNDPGWLFNQSPNSPSALAQKKTTDTIITTGVWTNESSVKFTATATDPDAADTLYLCIEKDLLGTSFSNTEDSCGSGVAYSGTGVAVTHTINFLTNSAEYHWQARTKDAAGAYSSWVSYGANLESARDFGSDTSAPTTGTVNDGTGTDQDYNDGSLTEISGNWTGFDDTSSGILKYEYAIYRESDSYYWQTTGSTWQSGAVYYNNSTTVSFRVSSMNLQTSDQYLIKVIAYDNAGNSSSPTTSNGQNVLPLLSFTLSSNNLDFVNLNQANNWTDSKDITITMSTNAANGYGVRSYLSKQMEAVLDPTKKVDDWTGTWATPTIWGTEPGFGYSSSDTNIAGANRFAGGTKFAAFTYTWPGDTVADHTNAVNGQTGMVTNEAFNITYRLVLGNLFIASQYTTSANYIITANF